MDFKITKSETVKRLGYVLIGFFTYYLVAPIRDLVNEYVSINPIIIGLVGIVAVLYFFKF